MLNNSIGLLTLAVMLASEGRHASGYWRWGLYILATIVALIALALEPITREAPAVGVALSAVFGNPLSWFVMFLGLFFVLRPFWSKPARPALPSADGLITDAAPALSERVAAIESELEGVKDGKDTLRAGVQAFMIAAMNMATEFHERLTGRINEVAGGAAQLESSQRAIIDDYQRMLALEARFEEEKKYVREQLGALFAHRSLDADALAAKFHRVFAALGAIYHRERLHSLAKTIEDGAEELSTPTTHNVHFDEDQWKQWEANERAWRAVLTEWCSLASNYVDGMEGLVLTVSEEQLLLGGQAKHDQFPGEGLVAYKAFWARLKNWRNWRLEAERAVHQAAFNSPERHMVAGGGDMEELGPKP